MTSEVPPRQSSNLNLSWSSGDRRDSFFCTLSNTLMVAKFVSSTTSNYKCDKMWQTEHLDETQSYVLQPWSLILRSFKIPILQIDKTQMLHLKKPKHFTINIMVTSNLSSSQRCSCSSYGVFFELTKVESSDQEGNETQVSFNTWTCTDRKDY